MQKIFLVDTSSLFFRAFYAVRPLTSPSGMPTNAIYGFLSMIIRLLKDEKPDYLVFCYDRKEPSFRKDIYPEYKANRSETPEELIPQIPYIKKLADMMGISSIEMQSYEADDLIGTLAKMAEKNNMQAYIVSGDKDFGQLVSDHIFLYDTMKDHVLGVTGVIEKWGIHPKHFIDYLALVGDSSDNIPGVRGIGPKGAQKLLEEYDSLEGIYQHVDEIKGSTKDKLVANKENAFLSYKLATIVTDITLEPDFNKYRRQPFVREQLTSFLNELNFKTLEKNLWAVDYDPSAENSSTLTSRIRNNTEDQLAGKNSQQFSGKSSIKSDDLSSSNLSDQTQSSGSERTVQQISFHKDSDKDSRAEGVQAPGSLFQSLSDEKKQSALTHNQDSSSLPLFGTADGREISYSTWSIVQAREKLKAEQVVWGFVCPQGLFLWENNELVHFADDPQLLGVLSDELKLSWCGFDLKNFWQNLNLKNPIAHWDSQLAAYVIKPGDSSEWERVVAHALGELPADLPSPEQILTTHLKLEKSLRHKLHIVGGENVYENLDLPLAAILYKMEKRGIHLDKSCLYKQNEEISADLKQLEKDIYEISGETFNIASPKQLAVVLFDKLKLPPSKKTKTGFSTDNDVLEKLRSSHPIIVKILSYRELAKLKSTYVEALPNLVKEDGRIHSHFHQALTTTGRLSSTEPNLQNIPIRTERGARVREAFVAEPGRLLLSVDYSQIELRVLAHFSQDPNLMKAFQDDLDIHAATASEVFAVPLTEVTSEQRRTAKAVNFGIAYGQGAFGLAENLGISRGEASEIIKKYFSKFSRVQNYIEDTIASAKEKGYVETIYGRRRYMDELKSKNVAIQKFGERAAINAPIQGTAADIVKKAMIDVEKNIPLPMILQVHDELIFEDNEDNIYKYEKAVIEIMESAAKLSVPLKVNASIGKNWGET